MIYVKFSTERHKMTNLKNIMIVITLFTSMGHSNEINANVIAVQTSGSDGAYRFAVTLQSTETGCDQYANWWEVLSKEGTLLYRRILVHSHPDTQPFTRSGGSVNIGKDDIVYVRGHMNKEGYVGDIFKGTVYSGFKKVTKIPNFSKTIETLSPLPAGCAF
jgi:hypothetical protein